MGAGASQPFLPTVAGRPAPPSWSAHATAGAALRAADLSFALRCDKALSDLEDLGSGKRFCADCEHTVDVIDTWGQYEAAALAGRCVAALIADPENAPHIAAAAVRVGRGVRA